MPNTALPVITGTATEGQLLTVSNGTWTNSPTSYTRQWVRCDAAGVNCVLIPSATGNTYVLTAADVGKKIRCWVTAFNATGASAAVETAATAVVAALTPAIPVVVTAPAISGTLVRGNILTISNGAWTNSPTSYTRQWSRCDAAGANCVNIAGATATTYTLVAADVGKRLRCTTTAVNATGSSTPSQSAATAVIADVPAPGVPVNTALPVVTGSPIVGATLVSSTGAWTNAPSSFTYQWLRCNSSGASCTNIAGATGQTYVVATADAGKTIRCAVKGVNATGPAATAAQSAATPVVADWVFISAEHTDFTLSATKEVRFGANGVYSATRVLGAGTYQCDTYNFGDPLPGVLKQCEVRTTTEAPPPPPPPVTWSPPITITAGGTYSGSWESTSATPAITVNTSAPVTITGRARNMSGGLVVRVDTNGAQVTFDHLFVYGPASSPTSERWLKAVYYKTLIVRNCTIENTRGIQLDLPQASSTVLITKNRHRNIQGFSKSPPGNFVQFRDISNAASQIVSWNEILNEPEKSSGTDLISLYQTSGAQILDNYFEHQSAPGGQMLSQNGITIETYGGPADNNQVLRNQVVDGAAIAVFSGSGNTLHDNRIVQDGLLPSGAPIASDYYEPIYIAGSNNHAHNNVIGYVGGQGWQYGRYPGTPEGDSGERAKNTYLSQPITPATEQNEKTLWLAKLASNGITIGA